MRYILMLVLLAILSVSVASAAYTVPDRAPESEQRIASMELNQSAGNMTGDDYLIALMYAYVNDSLTLYETKEQGDSFKRMQEEASSKFDEYSAIYYDPRLDNKLALLMVYSAVCDGDCSHGSGSSHYAMPQQGWFDLFVYEIFYNDSELHIAYPHTGSSIGISDAINKARGAYYTRVKEDAEREAARKEKEEEQLRMQQEMEAEQLRDQQENEARQIALDAYYKNASENYSTKIADLLNESNINEALNLSNESIGALVSPYRNIMMINRGDIYMRLGRYSDAIESYKSAQTDFTYSNESVEYKESVNQSFLDNKWDSIAEVKIGIAYDNVRAQVVAQLRDLRDAPDAKRLLVGHTDGKKYTVRVLNYTGLDWGIDYFVFVNLSAYNDIKTTDMTSYQESSIPVCIDIFGALFSDPKISNVSIQVNTSYYDKFGHIMERPYMTAALNSKTAKQIGDWSAFKQYIGTDVSKFEQVIDLKVI